MQIDKHTSRGYLQPHRAIELIYFYQKILRRLKMLRQSMNFMWNENNIRNEYMYVKILKWELIIFLFYLLVLNILNFQLLVLCGFINFTKRLQVVMKKLKYLGKQDIEN